MQLKGCWTAPSSRRPTLWRKLKARKLESGCDRATDERPIAQTCSCLPCVCRHDGLRAFAGRQIGTKRHALNRSLVACRGLKAERRAGLVVPDFRGIDSVPMRTLTAR